MQIRELNLKELQTAWEVLSQLRTDIDYNEFENLVYAMRESNYTMIGIFEKSELLTYAGVSINTNLFYKRHLFVHELVTDIQYRLQGYAKMMLDYLYDYAKMGACENIVLFSEDETKENHKFYEQHGFKKNSTLFVKVI
jgi:ribosomal protein S18 acetylase RimI-like enzyme